MKEMDAKIFLKRNNPLIHHIFTKGLVLIIEKLIGTDQLLRLKTALEQVTSIHLNLQHFKLAYKEFQL